MSLRFMVRGGGDLASGAALRLYRAGWQVVIVELPQPLVVRRLVSFAQAVFDGQAQVEDVTARLAVDMAGVEQILTQGGIPVLVDPALDCLHAFRPDVLVDGRMTKHAPETGLEAAPLVIGLGPGFTAGLDCHAVVETNRGPFLGRVIWQGQALPDTGIPEQVGEKRIERVLRAPVDGELEPSAQIGSVLKQGDLIARVAGRDVRAPFDGVLRGLVQGGLQVRAGTKIGDIDPRGDPRLSWLVSDKALAVAGGVLEAVLTWQARNRAG